MTTVTTNVPATQLDAETASLARTENELIALFTEWAQQRSDLDERYVSRVNALLDRTQITFDRVRELADACRPAIVTKGKSTRRLTGRHAWYNVTRATFGSLTDEEFIAKLRATGNQRLIRRFLRRVSRWEINRPAIASSVNASVVREELAPLFDGEFALITSEEYRCEPVAGFAVSTSRRLWPSQEGIPLPEVWDSILNPTEG